MSVKAVIQPYPVVVNQDMTTSVVSKSSVVLNCDNASYQVSYSGSPVGTFTVEASNDETNWSALVFAEDITTVNSPSPFLINMNQLPYASIRLVYTPVSGSGTLNAVVVAKRLGG